jgi:hypothetical protein
MQVSAKREEAAVATAASPILKPKERGLGYLLKEAIAVASSSLMSNTV